MLFARRAAARLARALLLILTLCRDAGRHRPIPSPVPSAAEGIGAPLGPISAGDPSRRLSPTTHPHRQQVGSWGRVVGLSRGTEPGEDPSGCVELECGTGEGRAGAGRRGHRSPDVCRGSAWCAPSSVCATTDDCSRRLRSPNGSGSPSATCGGWDAKASCRGSSCRDASTSGSPRRTSSDSSLACANGQRQGDPAVPRGCTLRRGGSEVSR